MQKKLKQIYKKSFENVSQGFKALNYFNNEVPIEPYLAFTEYYMSRPIFGPHPHAGVSVMTYMHPDSENGFINRDSFGDHSIIEPGGVHITQAGIGIQHDEVPQTNGVESHGFQIWINHSDKDRLVEPKALHTSAKEIPEVQKDGAKVRVIHGTFDGVDANVKMVTPVTLLDIYLNPNSEIELPSEEMTFAFIVSGNILVDETEAEPKNLLLFEEGGSTVKIRTKDSSANVMYASGKPHNEPIVYGGPYVMTTQEQLEETKKRYARGEMGVLKPLPS